MLSLPLDLNLEKNEGLAPSFHSRIILRKKVTWRKADSKMEIWPGNV